MDDKALQSLMEELVLQVFDQVGVEGGGGGGSCARAQGGAGAVNGGWWWW